jgi:two-component system, NtrC family, sensor kinase
MKNSLFITDIVPSSKKSLHLFLAAVVFLSIAVPAVISGGVLIHENYQRTIEQDSLKAANNYADLLEVGMGVALWNVSVELGKPLLESILVDPSVLSIEVLTEHGDVFLEHRRPSSEYETDESLTVTRNIQFSGAELGKVEVVYSLAKAKLRVANETKLLAVIILAQLTVSLVTISTVLQRRVLSPLKKLCAAAAGITRGDLRTEMPRMQDDEFGALSRELETMRGALEQNFMQLEKRVDQRTNQLQAANIQMKAMLEQLQTTQDNLIQSEKLAALGALVAGVAHELNTPIGNGLTVATTLCESCTDMKQQMSVGLTKTALEKFVGDMYEGAYLVNRNLARASELVTSFKQVAVDRTSAQRRKFSLREIVNETYLTLSPAFKRTPFIVEVNIVDDIVLDSYPGPLGQVITNLLNNALIHAFDGRTHGRVVIANENVPGGVRVMVTDDGVGIATENQAKIFDPFFTTKLGAGGNGLGMHIVHNIVTGVLGGTIQLFSQLGEGTRFTLFLPSVAPFTASTEDNELPQKVAMN